MNSRFHRILSTGLFGLALLTSGCAARHVDVRTDADSSSVRGRGQVNTEPRDGRTRDSSGSVSGNGTVSGSGSGSGAVSGSGNGSIQR
jgi:hypothetical protein